MENVGVGCLNHGFSRIVRIFADLGAPIVNTMAIVVRCVFGSSLGLETASIKEAAHFVSKTLHIRFSMEGIYTYRPAGAKIIGFYRFT